MVLYSYTNRYWNDYMVFKFKTEQDFKDKLFSYVGDEYELVSGFTRLKEKALFKHNICGSTFESTPDNFIYKKCRCPVCRDNNHAKSPKVFEKQFYEQADPKEYKLLTPYRRSHEKIKVCHLTCGNTYMVTPHDFLEGKRCPKCNGNPRKTRETFAKEVNELTNGEYILRSDYHNNRTNVVIEHTKCNHEYKVRPHDFLAGNRCPYCKESKGEKLIDDLLRTLGITYETQKYFPGLSTGKDKSYLKYDFYVPDNNLLIEYDGIQHFKNIGWFSSSTGDSLKKRKYRDGLKNDYAHDRGIDLVRFPYTLEDEEVISELKKLLHSRKAGEPTPKSRFMI